MRVVLFSCLLVLLVNTAILATAETRKDTGPIVSAEWLAEHLNDKNVVLLHIGRKQEFDKEHIAGAQYISTRDVSTTRDENPLTLELPAVEKLKAVFEGFGIRNDTRIVLYWGKDWVTPTTRIFFTLDYMGLADNVSILDGGMPAWKSSGNTTSAKISSRPKGKLTVKRKDLVIKQPALVDAILNNKPITIIDARTEKYFTGAEKGAMPRAGHIPNAQNIPYSSIVTDDLKFRSVSELQKLFDQAGVKKDRPVVTYCHIGQQASLAYFAARLLGYEVRIYDGSFQEWSRSKEKVIVEDSAKQ
ncbi:MAG: sulfurtransferase [Pyrinomonadaceae bacterium]|nr:sulfurtransferase [Pyrinomonadaceae bacterium]